MQGDGCMSAILYPVIQEQIALRTPKTSSKSIPRAPLFIGTRHSAVIRSFTANQHLFLYRRIVADKHMGQVAKRTRALP